MSSITSQIVAAVSVVTLILGWLWNQRRVWKKRGAEQVIEKMEDADEKRAQHIREVADLARRASGGGVLEGDTRGYRD